jgi:HKD family nuclease
MKTKVIVQPFEAVMGEIIQERLSSQEPFYNNIWLVSAFANAQAIHRITPSILESKARGANINIIVGFDVKSTSAEALQKINSLGVNSVLVHNERGGHTFHPKIYLFESADLKAELFIGSNNLTDGGLYTNYEASSQTTFDFPQDDIEYTEFVTSLDRYLNPEGVTAQILTHELIDILVRRGAVPTEAELIENQRQIFNRREHIEMPASPFGVERINRPPRLNRRVPVTAIEAQPDSAIIASLGKLLNHGDLLWQKIDLPSSDAQQPNKGNPTGGLRLTQAGWTVNGTVIDQTTYFRNDVFGNLKWGVWKTEPYRENAVTSFVVYILGTDCGIHNLTISHKPSGEAGQGNYTTILHWGDLVETIRQANIIGKTLSLYAPPSGQIEPYTIEIT